MRTYYTDNQIRQLCLENKYSLEKIWGENNLHRYSLIFIEQIKFKFFMHVFHQNMVFLPHI